MNVKQKKTEMKIMEQNKGITLIALVITIIVLLILAGVTIATLTGDNGLLTKTGETKNVSEKATEKEKIEVEVIGSYDKKGNLVVNKLKENITKNIKDVTVSEGDFPLIVKYNDSGNEYKIDEYGKIEVPLPRINAGEKAPANSNAEYKSENYTAIVPAGFTVSNVDGEKSIESGLVIRDDSGNEFVWIPVGIPWKSDSSKTIELSRYTFDSDGIPTNQGPNTINNYFTELTSSSYGNAVAKTDITSANGFITKTNAARGFWIGRYEARIEGYKGTIIKSNSNKKTSWTGYTGGKLVEKPGVQVFNYITQNKASELSKTMYEENNYFESDLINSYAWDTATLFLQEYDNRTDAVKGNSNYKAKYSNQIRLSEELKNTGTNASTVAETNKDKICNVYDMAGNCFEWTTEYSSYPEWPLPCVRRGGGYDDNSSSTRARLCDRVDYAPDSYSFRPILYIK